MPDHAPLTAGAPVDSVPESTMAAIVALVARTYPDGANQFEAVHLAATTAWIVARFSVEIRTVPASALPRQLGRLHLGERRSSGKRLCSHDHEVPAGHPLYWPQQLSEHDDSDPLCLVHAIEQAMSNEGWCEQCGSAAGASEKVTAALQAGEAILRGAGDGTYDEALDAIRLLTAALHVPPPVATATVVDAGEPWRIAAWNACRKRGLSDEASIGLVQAIADELSATPRQPAGDR
ncbi:hypothetical protein [Sphingomonas sp. BK235]|uniref:hypothetical protein n=1 Tax=Sphingomonas sp. BK235 TaxID=2512131 RepID=UPI0010510650|nr:hypothetical protein [Sphingomonas sp. BK235]TCP33243.1 hypothetical protein EV292_106185 [Sphingomonas sp. BK235]